MAIYKDEKRGTYYVSVYVELNNGDRKRVLKRGFKTRKEAKKAESEIVFNAAIDNPDNPFFKDVIKEYIAWYEKRRKASSLHRLKKECRLYIEPFFGDRHIQNIKKRDVMKFHDYLLGDKKLSITTSKNVHGYLSAIFNYAIKMEYVNINIAKEVGNIQSNNGTKMEYWELDEFKEFIKIVDNLKYKAIFMCLFYSGARVGELLALEWQDVDFDNNALIIDKTYSMGEITTPKTKSSVRNIKMPNHTLNLLRQLKLQVNPKKDYYVFGQFYNPLSHNAVQDYYNRIFINNDDLRRIRIHDFRHSHASYLINSGYDIQIVSKRLGHTKISTTYDKYAHLYPNKEDDAIKHMEDDFKPGEVIKLIK